MKFYNKYFALVVLGLTFLSVGVARAEVVEIAGGGTIAYDRYGEGEKVAVLVHGWSFSKEVWKKTAPQVADGWTLYA